LGKGRSMEGKEKKKTARKGGRGSAVKVWECWTTHEGIDGGENGEGRMRARPGGRRKGGTGCTFSGRWKKKEKTTLGTEKGKSTD